MPSRAGEHQAAAVRPRYSRITAAGSSLAVTGVAVLGATGVIPTGEVGEPASAATPQQALAPEAVMPRSGGMTLSGSVGPLTLRQPEHRVIEAVPDDTLPVRSGEGRRVVFDMSRQRVWLVDEGDDGADQVERTYLVSGSLTDNLKPGTYEVWSRSRDAIGIDDSGTMKYMVRFAHGERAAIGFHDIPVADGEKVQSRAQLGTPRSHGCIRQWRPDAKALWRFAPLGTTVVVTA